MDFFEQQDQSKARTSYLVVLFMIAVTFVVIAVYFAIQLGIFFIGENAEEGPFRFDWMDARIFILVAAVTLAVILAACIIRIYQLSKGGGYVAENLGGRLLNKSSADGKEKRLLNVVEEMAIAAGVPVPQVYVLDEETGINAFAAGYTPSDAAVAVTRGCLEKLNREELQGVIAHEFSHILNGDMRLNIRLIGFLFGIMVIANIGHAILRGSGRSRSKKGSGQVIIVALALMIIGYIGQLFGRMIQSAVSRQREYLADASAVQFTRNPIGIANALKKIGGFSKGSKIDSPHAPEVSHMFFSKAVQSLFSTHPPLDERIRRIEPGFQGRVNEYGRLEPMPGSAGISGGAFDSSISKMALDSQTVKAQVGQLTPEHVGYSSELLAAIPKKIKAELDDLLGSLALICALLLDRDPEERKHQINALKKIAPTEIVNQVLAIEKEITRLAPVFYFPVLELALPTLRGMSPAQFAGFKRYIQTLVEADGKLTLFEFIIQKMVSHQLGSFYRRSKKQAVVKSMQPLLAHTVNFLSVLAKAGHKTDAEAHSAYDAGFERLKVAGVTRKENFAATVSFKEVDTALDKLALATPAVKRTICDAICETVLFDREVTIREAELLRFAAAIMDIPVPPFIAHQTA